VLPAPRRFIAPVPHMSFVWGQSGVAFLQRRHQALRAHPYFSGMEYTQDTEQLAEWAPLVVQGRDRAQEIAAKRVTRGTDVDFGVLARAMFGHLQSGGRLRLHLLQEVTDLGRSPDGRWRVTVRDGTSGSRRQIRARFVFLGVGGGALPLLLRSGIPEGRGLRWLPGERAVAGLQSGRADLARLRARNNEVLGIGA
jgi:malate dehydrogenase (quinone)